MEQKVSVASFVEKITQKCREEGMEIPDFSVEAELSRAGQASKDIIDGELQDFFALLELGITAMVKLHAVCEKNSFLYACVSGKMVSQLLSMRILLYQGMMDSVKVINRAFHENMEIFFACLIDKQFADEYGKLEEGYNYAEFWKNHISNNRLDKYIHKLFDAIGYSKETKKEYFKRRDASKAFLSESVHGTFNSANTSYMMLTLDGEISTDVFGKITTAYPGMLYELLTDICILNVAFYAAVDEGKSPTFTKADTVSQEWLEYQHYMKMYDYIYDIYQQDLYQKRCEVMDFLNKLYQHVKAMEENQDKE